MILHAGDIATEGALEELRLLGPPIAAVHGNVDEPSLQVALPRERVVEVEGAQIGIVHDAGSAGGREHRLRDRFPGCHAVVYGHTHLPQVERHAGVWILNPGSPTERRAQPDHTYGVLELDAGRVLRADIVVA